MMTGLAAELLAPGAQLAAGGQPVERSVRLVLTGPGGGTWDRRLDDGSVPLAAADVVIVADTVDYCRLVANRLPPDHLTAEVFGEAPLAELVLAGATCFALD